MPCLLHPLGRNTSTHLAGWAGHRASLAFGEEKNLLPLPEFETLHPAHSIVTILTTLLWLLFYSSNCYKK